MKKDIVAVLLAGAAFGAALAYVSKTKAQTAHDAGHAQHHDVYQHWQRPDGSGISCCEGKRVERGGVIGDCYPTAAEIRKGVWWAKRDTGEWVEIPDNRIVRYPNPDPTGEGAHICEVSGYVYCFRAPNTGG